MEKFDKAKYDTDYRKKHKKQFNVDLNIDEYEELNQLLKLHNLTKIEFVRNSIKRFKEEKKMKKYCVRCETTHFVKDSTGWRYDGTVYYGYNDCERVFNTIDEATKFYNSIELTDDIQNNNSRYADSKALYEIEEADYDEETNEVNLNNAKIIRDDTLFLDYH